MNRKRIYPDLKTWRDEHRMGTRQAAKELGLNQSTYSRLERKVQAINPKTAKAISDQTGVPIESILGIA